MEQTCYLGCDVSKGYADFILLDSTKKVVEKVFVLDDNKSGREQLLQLIKNWQEQGLKQLFCGVESTGGYENNWYEFLKSSTKKGLPVLVARLNPKPVKAVSDASLKRTITDAVSAENIACYLILFSEKIKYNNSSSLQNEGVFYEGRQHYTFIKMLTKQKVQLNNQLEKLLYQNFSEILVYCRHGIPVWLLKMLIKFPCASSVSKAGIEKLSSIKGISKDKAEAILKKVKDSEQQTSKYLQHLISCTATEMLQRSERIDKEKSYLQESFKDNAVVKLLATIDGVGVNSAIELMLEIEDVNRFETAAKMASYFGVHPTFKQSGDGIWCKKMSKKGRGEIRATLYMCGMSGIRYNSIIKTLYARFRAKGMNHYAAMGVVMHKLLRIVYGVLKTNKGFDAKIDETNVTKASAKQEELKTAKLTKTTEEKTNRNRYQTTIKSEAPISRIKYQKIKKAVSVPMPNARQHTDLLTADANI